MSGLASSVKERQWRGRMGRFERSGRSVAEFCRREGVSTVTFYQWRKRLAASENAGKRPGRFVPMQVVAAAGVVVQLPGGTRLELPAADRQTLRLAIGLLARADARRAGGGSC